MASTHIHLAIAKRYLEKHGHEIADKKAFCDGNILPDYEKAKANSHYGNRSETKDLLKRHQEKVSPQNFLQKNSLDSDLNRGIFLHLHTDWNYYNNFLSHDYLKNIEFSQLIKDNCRTWNEHESYLDTKHKGLLNLISMRDQVEMAQKTWRREDSQTGNLQFATKDLDAFIEKMSDVSISDLATHYTTA